MLRAFVKCVNGVDPGIRIIGFRDGFDGILKKQFVHLDLPSVRGLLPRGGTILGTSSRDNPFAYPVRLGERWTAVDRSAEVRRNFEELGLDCLVAIGGDGTLKIARDLGMPLVGVPKTIDNDLSGTDITFGFRTAVQTAANALDQLHTTAESHHRVFLLEVMGRYAGFIALAAGLAGGADFILIPEIPYRLESVLEVIRDREKTGRFFSIGVVAEGARPVKGHFSVAWTDRATGQLRLGGAADRLARQLKGRIEHEVRTLVLGHLQRGGSPCADDRILATSFGAEAARAALEGDYGKMVGVVHGEIVRVPIDEAVSKSKCVDPNGPLCRTARGIGIGLGD